MAIPPRNFEVSDEMLKQMYLMPPVIPGLMDMINKLENDREEMLLAVMAAGIPKDCIELVETSTFDFKDQGNQYQAIFGFKFTTNNVYT